MKYPVESKKNELIFNDDDVVTRANAYITAKSSSNLLENKIFALATKKADYDENGRLSVKITASELRGLLQVNGNGFYDTLKKTAASMRSRALYFERKDSQEFAFINLLTSAVFRNGVFQINFNSEINSLIRGLKRDYTSMKLSTLFQFRSVYSFRLYEVLKIHAFKINKNNPSVVVEYGLSELKMTLNMIDTENKEIKLELQKKSPDYDRIVTEMVDQEPFADWYRFKVNVIEKAISEINDITELFVQYKTIRKGLGGKVVKIIFYVLKKEYFEDEILELENKPIEVKKEKKLKKKELIEKVLAIMPEVSLTQKDAQALLKAADNDLQMIENAYNLSKKQGYIKNFMGWMIGAIRDGYEDPIAVMGGSQEIARKINKVKKDYENKKEKIAKQVWEETKRETLFEDFLSFIDQDIASFEKERTPKECYAEYIQWKIKQI